MTVSHENLSRNETLPSGQTGVSKTIPRDPFIQILKSINFQNPWTIFVLVFLLGMVDDIGIGAVTGNWRARPGVVGVFEVNNIPPLIMSLIVMPGIWAYSFGFPGAFFRLFETIQKKGIILTNQTTIRQQIEELKSIRRSWLFILTAIPLTIGFVFYSLQTIGSYRPAPWYYLGWHWWIYFARLAITYYAAVYSSLWTLIALFTLSSIFRDNRLKVDPYDGDNAGGLRFIGTFILEISRVTLVMVPFLVGETLFALRLGRGFSGQFNLWLELLVLPSLLFIFVFVPLTACRQAMYKAKDEFLNPVRDRILNQLSEIKSLHRASKDRLEATAALIDLQNKLRKEFPTWPFDMSMSQQVGISFFLALMPVIFNIVQQIISNAK